MDEQWWRNDEINASDMYATAALSMPHMIRTNILTTFAAACDADTASAISKTCAPPCVTHISCILNQIPADANVRDSLAGHYINLANRLWKILFPIRPKGVGQTGLSKLVARKCPHLLPVIGTVSKSSMRLHNGGLPVSDYWKYFHVEMGPQMAALDSGIAHIRSNANVLEWTSDIRVIDILVWMEHKVGC